jgi:TolB-like protein/Tfp pilus assembly protein PilF
MERLNDRGRCGNPMKSFFRELKRRNVYKVAVAYAVVGWLLIEIASILFPTFEAPAWVMKIFVITIAAGFPIALIITWAFELTPEGIKRTESVSPPRPMRRTWIYVVGVAGVLSIGLFFLGRYTASRADEGGRPASSAKATAAKGDESLPKSIAVLPFENRSEDKANAFFADGIQDEILTRLAKIGDLKVISRTSTQRYKSSPENLAEIAKQLGVEHVLEGSVQKAGDQVRVTVQLIRGVTDSHVWAETYDRKLTDIFAVESEIAETIARSLQAKLTPLEQRAVTAKPTKNPAAYEEYLHGRALWNRATSLPEDGDEMIKHFSRAVELDPKFALGWAFLSVAHSHKYAQFDHSPSKVQAKEALDRAFSLEPDLGEAYLADGIYCYRILRDSDQALAAFQKARDRAANRALAVEYSSYVKRRQGKWDEALQLHAESLDLDPRNPHLLAEVANTYHALRRFDEAQSLIDRAREIEPENAQLLARKAYMLLEAGDSATAGRLFEGVRIDGADPLVTMIHVRYWIVTRQFSDAIRALKSVIEEPENLPELKALTAVCYRAELAVVEALAGNPEARAGLDRARGELSAIRAHGRVLNWTSRLLLVISGFVHDKETVDSVAAQVRERSQNDAMYGPGIEEVIAKARAHLGETDAAIESVKQLLQASSGNSLTPALLRADPLWDPLRNDPRFQELAETKP